MYKYFKYPINHPSKYASLQKEADAGRWIWNYFLTRNINQYQIDKTFVWYNQMVNYTICQSIIEISKNS